MKYVNRVLIVILIYVLISFIPKDATTTGLRVGEQAPDFTIRLSYPTEHTVRLSHYRHDRYILLSFWASYDAASRAENARLNHLINNYPEVEMISVSFDRYRSVFDETVRNDAIKATACFVETDGKRSSLYRKYDLGYGFANYLLDADGTVIAKNVSADDLERLR
jgi:thiol-disulfide isomerase/thioredoxin